MSYFVGGAIIGGAAINAWATSEASDSASEASSEATAITTAEQARQYNQTRADYEPWRQTGQNALAQLWDNVNNQSNEALPQFQGGSRVNTFDQSGNPLPQFDGAGNELPGPFTTNAQVQNFDNNTNFQQFNSNAQVGNNVQIPQWLAGETFDFDLQADEGFQFAVDQAVDQTMRVASAQGKRNSGNVLAEISDRAAGAASQYADQAFNRQLAESNENYGRSVTDQQMTTDQQLNQHNVDRQTTLDNYGLATNTHQIQNADELTRFNVATGTNQLQNQNVLSQLGIDRSVYDSAYRTNQDQFGRDLTLHDLAYRTNQDTYNRDYNNWLANMQVNNTNYGRDVGEYGMDYQQNQDMYGRDQTQMNWLSTIAGTGQNATGATAAAGANMANNISNAVMNNANNQINASNMYYSGMNNSFQGALSGLTGYHQQQTTNDQNQQFLNILRNNNNG